MTNNTFTTPLSASLMTVSTDKALALALRLAHSENALRTLTMGQVDAIVDPDGNAYMLRPAQENLRRNERRLQAILESIPDAITVVNRGGMILSQSSAVRQILGYGSDELVGGNIFALIHVDDLPLLYSAFFNVIEELFESTTVQFRHKDRDGSYRNVEAAIGKLRDATSVAVVFSLRLLSR